MTIFAAPSGNDIQTTIATGHSYIRGTTTDIYLTDHASFADSVHVALIRNIDYSKWALIIYSSKTTGSPGYISMSAADDYALARNVSTGDEAYEWPAGSIVELICASDEIAQLFAKLGAVQDDTAPKLGGDLDRNGYRILGQIVGIEWNQATDTWTRIDKAGNPAPLVTRPCFDDWLPWAGMRRVNLAVDGTINAVYGDAGYKEDGSNGRVMVEVPKFWVKSVEVVANKYRWWIADHPVVGFEVHPWFNQRATSKPADYAYIGAYAATLMDDAGTIKLDSKADEQPLTGSSIAEIPFVSGQNEPLIGDIVTCEDSGAPGQIVDYHKESGTWGTDAAGSLYVKHPNDLALSWATAKALWNDSQTEVLATTSGVSDEVVWGINLGRTFAENIGAHWGLMTIWALSAIQLLFMVEYGNLDSQTNIGEGIAGLGTGAGFAGENTAADSINDNLGETENGTGAGTGDDGTVPIAYRWIENLWGNIWKAIDGFEATDTAYRILKASGLWDDSGPSVWDSDDYDESSAVPLTGSSDGYISNVRHEALLKYLLIPSACGGSSSLYIPDYCWVHDDGELNILLTGGDWARDLYAGLKCKAMTATAAAGLFGVDSGTRLEAIF